MFSRWQFICLQAEVQYGYIALFHFWRTLCSSTGILFTYHNQLGGEVSALSTDVGDVPAGLEESLAVATSLGARHPYALLRLVRLKRSIF